MKKVYFLLTFVFFIFLTGCNGFGKNKFGNPEENQKNYDLLVEKLNESEQKMDESGYLTITIQAKINGQKATQVMRVINDPLYIEIPTDSTTSYIVQEGESVYSYVSDFQDGYDKNYLGDISKFNVSENTIDGAGLLQTTFDKRKCRVTYSGDTFITESYYKDALNEEGKLMLEDMFRGSGFDVNSLYDVILTTKYSIFDKRVKIVMSMSYPIEEIGETIDVELVIDLNYNKFARFNFEDIKGYINLPDTFDDAREVVKIKDKVIAVDKWDVGILKINVQKGVIVLEGDFAELKLFDANIDRVNVDIEQVALSDKFFYYIPVLEEGEYYLCVTNEHSYECRLLVDFNEADVVNELEVYEIENEKTYEGEISWHKEIDKFTYEKNGEEKTIKITNLGQETISLFYKGDSFENNTIDIIPNQARYIDISKYKDIVNIYFRERDLQKTKNGYLYKVKFEVLNESKSEEIVEGDIVGKNTLASFEKRRHYTYLEKGIYCIQGQFIRDYYYIYNYDNDKPNSPISLIEISSEFEIKYHLIVTEDNWYYLSIVNNASTPGTFTFTKLDVDVSMDQETNVPNIGKNTHNTGTIKNSFQYDYYLITNDANKQKFYILTNNSDEPFRLIIVRGADEYLNSCDITISPNEKIQLPVENKIKLIVAYTNLSINNNYDFTIEELDNSNYTNMEEYENVVITKEFSDNYFVGFEGTQTYAKIILEEEGTIGFVYENHPLYGESKFNVTVYSLYGEVILSGNVPPGEYIVCFENRSSGCVYAKIKYALVSNVPVKEVVELKELDESNNNDRYSDIYNRKILIYQDIKYYFSLDKKTSVCFDPYIVYIYSSTGTLLSCPATDTMERRDDYIILPAGEYYFTTPKLDGYSGEKQIIPIGIKETKNDSPLDITEMQTLYEGTSIKVDVEKGKSVKYFKLFIPSFMRIKLSYGEGQGYLYRMNGTTPTELGDDWIYLNGGTYILMVVYDVDDARTVIIKAERVSVYS